MRPIILVAGVGWRLKPHTEATPKCLLDIGGKTLLRRYLEAFAALGLREAVLVVGHLKEKIMAEAARGPAGVQVRFVTNEQFTRGNILSLWHARHEFDDDVVIMDGDVLFPREMLARLLASPDSNAMAVDERFRDSGEEQKVLCEDGWVVEVTKKVSGDPRVRGEEVTWVVIKPGSVLASDVFTNDRAAELYDIRHRLVSCDEVAIPASSMAFCISPTDR